MLINGNEASLSIITDRVARPTFSPARSLRKVVRILDAPASTQDTNREEWDGESPLILIQSLQFMRAKRAGKRR
jgi:hypothetical protein